LGDLFVINYCMEIWVCFDVSGLTFVEVTTWYSITLSQSRALMSKWCWYTCRARICSLSIKTINKSIEWAQTCFFFFFFKKTLKWITPAWTFYWFISYNQHHSRVTFLKKKLKLVVENCQNFWSETWNRELLLPCSMYCVFKTMAYI
jgi:hypothetical protein